MDVFLVIYIYAFFSSLGFALLYNVRGYLLFWTALGGAVGQFAFDVSKVFGLPVDYLLATLALALYSEIMARFTKVPVMVYLTVGVLPIVPGAGVYHTMFSLFNRDEVGFVTHGTETLLAAGSIALAIVLVSSTVRLFKLKRFPFLRHHQKSAYKPNMR